MSYTYYFNNKKSPTQYNLDKHMCKLGFVSKAPGDFNDTNLTLDESCTIHLEYKHLLHSLLENNSHDITPLSYCINDHNCFDVLDRLSKKDIDFDHWILKPSMLNNAEGVYIFDSLQKVYQHYQGNQRYGGEHVLQRYIHRSHLLNDHKYTFRMFVVITNYSGSYLYKDGYFNVAKEVYAPLDVTQLNSHLTNEHLASNDRENCWQIPTIKCPDFYIIYRKMEKMMKSVMVLFNKKSPDFDNANQENKAFSLFGFDFILDEKMKLWLLEINHGPCFPISENHVLQKYLYDDFWQSLIKYFITPLINNEGYIENNIFHGL